MQHESEQTELRESVHGTPANTSNLEGQNPLASQSVIDSNTYMFFNLNRFGQGKSLVRYSEDTVDLARFCHKIALSDNPSHTLIQISGTRNDCWLRAAWLSIFTQIDPENFARSLRNQLASRLQIRSMFSNDELVDEAESLEPALTKRIRHVREYLERNIAVFSPQEQQNQRDEISELESEQRIGKNLRWDAGLRDLNEDIGAVIQLAHASRNIRTFNQATEQGNGGGIIFRNEDALRNVTYWILKQQSQYLMDSVLTSSVLGNAMGDDDQIAALHQVFSVTSIVHSRPPVLDICPQADSPLLPGTIDLGWSVQDRADNLALAAAYNTVVFHSGLHFSAALPNVFFQS